MKPSLLPCVVAIGFSVFLAACSKHKSEAPPLTDLPPPQMPVSGPEAVQLPPAELPALMGTAWSADFIEGKGDIDNRESTLEFLPEGRVAGRAGCNRYGGPVEITGKQVKFGALMATKMACDIMDQEQKFMDALAATRTYRMEDGRLVLADEAGTARVRLLTTAAAGP